MYTREFNRLIHAVISRHFQDSIHTDLSRVWRNAFWVSGSPRLVKLKVVRLKSVIIYDDIDFSSTAVYLYLQAQNFVKSDP